MSPDDRKSSGEISAEHLEMQPLLAPDPPPEPAQEVVVNPLTLMFGEYDFKKFFVILLATGIFVVAMYIFELAAVDPVKRMYAKFIAIAMLVLSTMLCICAFATKTTFGPWSYFRRRLHSTEMQAEMPASQDIESQHPISPCNHDIELSSSSTGLQPEQNATVDEQRLIEVSGDEISSSFSKLPPRCALDAEAVEKSSELDDSTVVEASSQPGPKIDPEPEVLSSGELRRRKLEHSGELALISSSSSEDCKQTSSSDEETVKKE